MESAKPDSPPIAAVPQGDRPDITYRSPPHNIEAERALLGALLVNNDAAYRINTFLMVEHFFEPLHGRIFGHAMSLVERGQIADPTTLKNYFEGDEVLAEFGGVQYLARLAGAAITTINAEDYGRLIYDLHVRRELIQVGEEMVNVAYDSDVDDPATEQVERAEEYLFGLAEKGQHEGGFAPFKSAMATALTSIDAAHKSDGELTGLTTGLRDLDNRLGGMHRSDLIIIAGRPSMGKTALATNIAFNAAKALRREPGEDGLVPAIGFFSLEMSSEQLATRMLSEQTQIPSEDLRRGRIQTDRDWPNIVQASQDIENLNFFIDDTPALSISALRTRARRLKRQHGLALVVVDYLQLLRPAIGRRVDNRALEVSEITQGLKALAKELEIPVLALSQLSRKVEDRDDKRPQLADLRESGAIEQDSDVVMFVYRPEYYHERREPEPGTSEHADWQEKAERIFGQAEINIGKQRHGPTGTVWLQFQREFTRFGDLDQFHDDAY